MDRRIIDQIVEKCSWLAFHGSCVSWHNAHGRVWRSIMKRNISAILHDSDDESQPQPPPLRPTQARYAQPRRSWSKLMHEDIDFSNYVSQSWGPVVAFLFISQHCEHFRSVGCPFLMSKNQFGLPKVSQQVPPPRNELTFWDRFGRHFLHQVFLSSFQWSMN